MAKISTNSYRDLLTHIGITVALILVFFLGFFFVYLPFTTNHGESVTVPDVQKMDVRKIGDFLGERDLNYEVSDCTFVTSLPPLAVISQYPKPGSKVKEGRKIYVTVVMQTVPVIKMPKVTDMSHKSAEMLLKSNGLLLGALRYVPDLAHGSVLKQFYNGQEIAPGSDVPKGSRIDLEVGNGLGSTTFPAPSVVGMLEDEAEFQIVGAGLKVGQRLYVTLEEGQEAGSIVKQNPSAGSNIRIGEVIDIWIAGSPLTNEN
jgi:beta-lactam-binding protein with PASTA domain